MTAWQWDAQAQAVDPNSEAWVKSLLATTPMGWVIAAIGYAVRTTSSVGVYERHGTTNDGLDANFWLPGNSKPGLSNDHHFLVEDEVTGRTQDMWEASLGSDGRIDSWRAGAGYTTEPVLPYVPREVGRKNASTNASDVPAGPSALRPSDVAAGVAPRTMRFGINLPGPGRPRYPAAPYAEPYPGHASNMPLGAMIRLPSAATLSAKATPLERCVFETLKLHGAVSTDGGSDLSFKAVDEGGGGQGAAAWAEVGVGMNVKNGGVLKSSGALSPQMTLIPWHLLQVLVPPPQS